MKYDRISNTIKGILLFWLKLDYLQGQALFQVVANEKDKEENEIMHINLQEPEKILPFPD